MAAAVRRARFDDQRSAELQLSWKSILRYRSCVASFHIRSLSKIHDHLSRDLTSRLCTSFVLGRSDYCNSHLTGFPKCSRRPLQLAQNMAARLIFRARKSCRITPFLQELDWLPINERIEDKILKITSNPRTVYAHHTFHTCLTRKYIIAPLDQLMATV